MGIPFTRENASEMARRGNLKRWSPEHRAQVNGDAHATVTAIPEDDYRVKRLARVRRQLDRVDRMMLHESDPSKLDRLASAQARLSEQERILDGRPTPGQLRPAAASKRDSRRSYSPPVPTASAPSPAQFANQTPLPVVYEQPNEGVEGNV